MSHRDRAQVPTPDPPAPSGPDGRLRRRFAIALARAFGGAIFFALPLLMTMEMWWFGFSLHPGRIALFLVAFFPVLVGLSRFSGFEETTTWADDVVDGLVAYCVGFVTAAAVLALTGILTPGMSVDEAVGMVAIEAVPASVGAVVAEGLLGGEHPGEPDPAKERKKREVGYGGELFLMAAGAIFFAFNIAPTEEVILIGVKMTEWHAIALAVVSLVLMHAFVYAVEFRGQAQVPPDTAQWELFLRFTVVGYAIALLVSAYVLWTFGRFQDSGLAYVAMTAVVLGFPASLGAAAARLIL